MAYNKIILEKKNGIAKIILNRPDVLNAIDEELLSEFIEALAEVEKDDSVNVVILSGAGRAFSAGRDIKGILGGQGRPGDAHAIDAESVRGRQHRGLLRRGDGRRHGRRQALRVHGGGVARARAPSAPGGYGPARGRPVADPTGCGVAGPDAAFVPSAERRS